MNKGPIPIVVAVVKNREGKLLIAKRRDREIKKADGLWELPGGHIKFKEDPKKATVREVLEETGIKVKILRLLPKIFNNYWSNRKGQKLHTLLISYECVAVKGKLQTQNRDYKIGALRWIDPKEISKFKLLPKTKEIISMVE